MSSKVLIIGANGYIGNGVARAFRRSGYKVYGVIRKESAKKYLIANEIIPVIGDQSAPDQFKQYIEECNIIVDAIGKNANSDKFFDYVLDVKSKLPNADLDNYKSLFIFTSGLLIYGNGFTNTVLDETVVPTSKDEHEMIPRKKFEDRLLSTTSIRTVVIRPGFVYGGSGGAVWNIFFGINVSEPLVFNVTKDKKWSWVHIDDLGEAYVKVARAGRKVDSQLFNIVELGDYPRYEDVRIAAATAAGWKGGEVKVDTEHMKKNWDANVVINPQKAYDLLGWRPSHVGVLQEIDIFYHSWKAHKELHSS